MKILKVQNFDAKRLEEFLKEVCDNIRVHLLLDEGQEGLLY